MSWRSISLLSVRRAAGAALFAMLAISVGGPEASGAMLYGNRAVFESKLGSLVLDDYEHPGYEMGQNPPPAGGTERHSDSAMNAIIGETRYRTTSFANFNLISLRDGNHYYCAGCNGSYELDFTATSVGSASGVFGVGLDVPNVFNELFATIAFVTFGDGTTGNFALPGKDSFWGIASPALIRTIHFGRANGLRIPAGTSAVIVMDNLTIGSAVPEPAAAMLLLLGWGWLTPCRTPRRGAPG